MELAKKNHMEKPWLAFIPIANTYLLGKLGFEIYPNTENKKPTLVWIFFGLSIFGFFETEISLIINLAIKVFSVMAYYNIYKYMFPNEVTKYTVLSFFFEAIPLYFMKDNLIFKTETVVNSEVNLNQQQNYNTVTPDGNLKIKFCSSCGKQLSENDKFCTNCGNKIM